MDVHELDQAFQEVVNASRGDSGAFEACWTAFCDLIGHDLEDQAGLVAEAVFGEEYVTVALKQSFINQRKAGSSTRQKILRWLLDLLPRLEPGQLVQYVPAVLKAARYHAVNEETANPRRYALELLSLILSLMLEGQVPPELLPELPLALAAPLQRIFLSSEARQAKSLKAALLGVLGLLLQLSTRLKQPASTSGRLQGVEPLTRHWLRDMCKEQLSDADVNQGAIEGMTAALELLEPGEADADLADMIAVVVKLVAELTATTRPGGRNPTSYGKYKAALACLQKLGPRFVAARLLTRTAPLATGPGAAAAAAGQPVVAVVLLEGLLEVSANSVNKEMRAAAEAALTATASLVCSELLEARSPDGAVVLKSIVGSCSAQLAGGNTTAGEGGAGWLRGAVEVLGKLCPAVASYQGVQVLG